MNHKMYVFLFWMLSGAIYAQEAIIESKIINGTQVSSNSSDWRFIASLKWKGNHYCGGSLISSKWVLTAAHCLVDSSGTPYTAMTGDTVGLGNYNVTQTEGFAVKRFIVHPQYNPNTSDNDIGLIELTTEALGITTIKKDTTHTLATGTQTKVAGWGTMTEGISDLPDNLMEALTPIVDFAQCNSAYNGDLTNNMLCAGYFVSTRDSCQGDSGGPLMVNDTLVGIVSWGYGCAEDGFPGVYTKVKNYATWIESYVPKESLFVPIMVDNISTFVPYFR